MPFKAVDLRGRTQGRLTIIDRVGTGSGGSAIWLCRCACGAEKAISAAGLMRKERPVQSCGCLVSIINSAARATHRDCGSTEYRTWFSMKARCFNKKHVGYPNYGGRGITVCDRWNNSYESFLSDMGRKPSAVHSIDRVDNDGNYEPGNCRWATKSEQARNTRNSKRNT